MRVEPTGESVIAGRAAPDSDVALLDGETVIGHVRADKAGQFAFVPPTLSEGSHYLSLETAAAGQATVRSAQGVAVSVAASGATKPLVALLSPGKPADILSDGVTPATGPSEGKGPASQPTASGTAGARPGPASPVAIQSVQAGQNGNFLAAGVAHPGSQCRVYLNGAYLADVTAGRDGKWSVEIKKGMQPGRYTVRADELDPAGAVSHRVEVPFEYPATAVAGHPAIGSKRLLLSRAAGTRSGIGGAAVPSAAGGPPRLAGDGRTTVASLSPAPGDPASPPRAAPVEATGAPAARSKASSADASAASVAGSSPAAAIVPDLHTTTVIRGDSLWRISRKMLGHGIDYTEIYASNANQIRDPALIFPGQIFVVPSKPPNG